MATPMIQQQVTFVYVSDLARSAAFYQDTLGLKLVLDQGGCRIYQVTAQAFLGTCQRAERQPAGDSVVLTLVSDEVDAWGAYLEARGVEMEKPPAHNPTYNIYHLFLRDPDGYLVEIQEFLDPTWPK